MKTDTRAELLEAIAELSARDPELRLGQLIANLTTQARGPNVEAIWDTEDHEMLDAARRLLEHYRARTDCVV